MNKIHLMSDELANKIAAGEVVERPLSIVKELVENALDAGSNRIKIELTESGIRQIIVTDNGEGVSKLDIPLMLKRHATSKIKSDIDLFNIATLGFRGEALASISAVSHVEIKSNNGEEGYLFNNTAQELVPTPMNKGTQVTVSNLFYNTPARFKHLSHPNYELGLISQFIKRMSLINPQVSFTLINNNKLVYQSNNHGDIISVFSSLYGLDIARKVNNISVHTDDYQIDIYLVDPLIHRSSNKDMIISVNHRLVYNRQIQEAIIKGCRGYLHTGEFPIVYLNINIDYSLVDVNIHPSKHQIKLSFLEQITQAISEAVAQKLIMVNFIPEYTITSEDRQEEFISSPTKGENKENKFIQQELSFNDVKKGELPQLRFIGALYQTYLLYENEAGLYLLDQHAAQERINYERFLEMFANYNFHLAPLLVPIKMPIDNLLISEEALIAALEKLGIVAKAKENSLVVTALDQFYQTKFRRLDEDIHRVIDLVNQNQDITMDKVFEKVAIMMACKSSIKAHQYLSERESADLLNQLSACDNPFTCPHGRPILNLISNDLIERLFKRKV